MGFAFRKRDAVLIALIIVFAAIIFFLGFIIGANSGFFDKDPADDKAQITEPTATSPVIREDTESAAPTTTETVAATPTDENPTDDDEQTDDEQTIEKKLYYIDRWVDLFDEIHGDVVRGVFEPKEVEVIDQEENWIKIDTEIGEKWVDIDSIRQTVRLNVPSYNQTAEGYPLGCEVVALAMLMNYTNKDVSVHDIATEMPRDDHPDKGFRGDPASTTQGWTIFPPALKGLMEKYMGSYNDMSGCEMRDLKEKLNENIPVLVWIRGLGWPVHALCLTGYDVNGFFYNDPSTGMKDTYISDDEFFKIWNDPIIDRLLGNTYDPRKAMSR